MKAKTDLEKFMESFIAGTPMEDGPHTTIMNFENLRDLLKKAGMPPKDIETYLESFEDLEEDGESK